MGNLGGYETAVRVIKSLGGPKKAAQAGVALLGGVFLLGGATYAGAQKSVSVMKTKLEQRAAPCPTQGQQIHVVADGESSSGLRLRTGDDYRVLEGDGDVIIIEVAGDADSPHVVSTEFLRSVSDFPREDD